MKKYTNIKDESGNKIYVGDTLNSVWGYSVIVVKAGEEFVGQLICGKEHPCKDIPYALNNGKDYLKELKND